MRFSVVLALLPLATATPAAKRATPAPLLTRDVQQTHMADKYIVKFKDGSPMSIVQNALKHVTGDATHQFEHIFQGFAAKLDKQTVDILRYLPDVDYIEQDATGTSTGYVTQTGSTWGLGRISHRQKGSTSYVYDSSAGKGVCAYVTDSGVDERHPEFEGRAHQIKSFIQGSNVDDLGHGTHCAGTIGSKSYGVAKQIEIYGVKVLSAQDRFQYSDLIAAYDFIAQDSPKRNCPNGVVVSGSLGGSKSQSLNDAANKMVDRGYFMAVASGNNNDNASYYSPASASKVCTVGGSDSSDRRYTQSNYGSDVNIIGPAVSVLSTLPNNDSAYYTGTSMATPHIAGLAAYLASRDGVKVTPSFCGKIQDMATKNAIVDQSANTVNLLAFNGNPSG